MKNTNGNMKNGTYPNGYTDALIIDTKVPCVVICPCNYGHGIARSLGRLGVPVYGLHKDLSSPTAKSKYWRKNFHWGFSDDEPDAAVQWLLHFAEEFDEKPILIPTNDSTSQFLYDNSEDLQKGYRFPERPDGLTTALANKQQLYQLCKKYNIDTPETAFPQNRSDVVDFIEDATFPVVLKGINTVALQMTAGVRMVIAEDADTLLRCYDEMESDDTPNLMLQEYIPGGSADVWMFNGYFDENSDCLFDVTGRKLRQYPAYTGVTSLGICEQNNDVSKITREFMKKIGYSGVLDIGYKYDARRDKYFLLDPNPRVGASFRLFVDTAEMDVVRAQYFDLTKQPLTTGEFAEGRKWLYEHGDMASTIRYWRDGKLKFTEWIRSFGGVKEAQWFAVDDLRPFYNMCKHSLKSVAIKNTDKHLKTNELKDVNKEELMENASL